MKIYSKPSDNSPFTAVRLEEDTLTNTLTSSNYLSCAYVNMGG
jgi:hypothetical protein